MTVAEIRENKAAGNKIPAFKDNCESIVDAVRRGMAAFPGDTVKAAQHTGLGKNAFGVIRRLMLILDQVEITEEQRREIRGVLDDVEKNRHVGAAASDLFHRYEKYRYSQKRGILIEANKCKEKRDRSREAVSLMAAAREGKKNRKRFDRVLLVLEETCEMIRDMSVPDNLTPDDSIRAVDVLVDSIETIARLSNSLRHKGEDYA